ncbi:MAG: hypothetical protein MJZ94_09280 [Bacteroidales bacterium]|nr:hypothetical protein [Bacteroidales bacterium]
MKRKAFTLCVATLVFAAMLSSCKKKENGDERITTFYATTDMEGSKTDLNGTTGAVTWTSGDAVTVFNADGSKDATFTLSAGEGTDQGTFTGEIEESATYYGIYPANDNHSLEDETITMYIPQEQTYRANNFGLGSAPMVAKTTGSTMQFKHVCGGIAIDLVATEATSITGITVNARNYEGLNGYFVVNSDGVISSSTSSTSTTHLNCNPAVELDPTTPTRFYIMLPARTYSQGLEVIFKNGDIPVCTKNIATSGVTIPRATIKTLQQLDVNPAEPGAPVITSVGSACPSYYSIAGKTNISSAGSGNLVTVGFCWTTTESEASTVTKGTNNYYEENNSTGFTPGNFLVDLTGKQPSTTYYLRSYATNSNGVTAYSEGYAEVTTRDNPPANLTPGNITAFNGSTVLGGEFTIDAAGHKVKFLRSNLLYNPSTNAWKVAGTQYYMGEKNKYTNGEDVSSMYNSTYTSYITFFGWGTSGYYANNTYYKPWETGRVADKAIGYGYGPLGCQDVAPDYALILRRDLFNNEHGQCENSDWGIYNSGSNRYRTLTGAELNYIIEHRTNATQKRGIAKLTISGSENYYGYVLLPDNFTLPEGCTWIPATATNTPAFSSTTGCNSYTETQWTAMQTAGAVFFPCNATCRKETTMEVSADVAYRRSYYWTSSVSNEGTADAYLLGGGCNQGYQGSTPGEASYGCYVRLVKDVN